MERRPYLLTVLLTILLLLFFNSISQAQTSFNISNKTTGDTLLSIDNDGKVGIGTTSPGASVDVKSAAVENGSSLNLGNYDDSHWLYLYSGRSGASALSPVMIWNEGDPMRFASWGAQYNEYMRISGNGFLGLGTDNPGVKLDIQLFNNDPWERAIRALNPTMIADDALFLVLGKSDDLKNMGHMNFKYLADASDENRLSFGLWGVNDVLNILGSGNVGIGIINPTQKLEVDGTVHSISGGFRFPDGSVQITAAGSGGVIAIDDLTDGKAGGNSVFLGSGAGANDDGNSNYNSAVGVNTLNSNTEGEDNAANGYNALYSNITGSRNVGLGAYSNYFNQLGNYNTIIGYQAGRGTAIHNKSGNIFLGYQAGYNEIGSNLLYIENSNSASPLIWGNFSTNDVRINGDLHIAGNLSFDGTGGGVSSIDDLTDGKTGGNSVFLGSGAGENDDESDNQNTAIGINALHANTTGIRNTANGFNSLFSNTYGHGNTANGFNALYANTSGDYNTANGSWALFSNSGGNYNTGVGFNALYGNTTGSNNTAIGHNTLYDNTTGYANTASGYYALANNTVGYENTAMGEFALFFNQDGNYNTAVGFGALSSSTSTSNNSAFGYESLKDNTTGYNNTAIGYGAMRNNTTGYLSTAIGHHALGSNTTGNGNTAIGHLTLYANIDGGNNTGTGIQALWHNTSGYGNTANGFNSLDWNTSGYSNTAMGTSSLSRNTTGINNVGIGHSANFYNQEGSTNTIIGTFAGYGSDLHNKSGNVFIGYRAGYNETGDDKLYIENSNSSTPLIGGDFSTNEIYLNGRVGIGEVAPMAELQVGGTDGVLFKGTFESGTLPATGAGTRMMWYPAKAAFRVGGVFGSGSTNWDDDNIGIYSFATGSNSRASSTNSMAMGYNATASNDYTIAIGYMTNASGLYSTAIGQSTTASGFASLAMGRGTLASVTNATALGYNTTASGLYSTALGSSTTAGGNYSTAMGNYVFASGDGSFVIGDNSTSTTTNFTSDNRFNARFSNGFYLYTVSGSPWVGAYLGAGLNSWGTISDSTKKENIQSVNSEEILTKIGQFKLSTWNYIGQDAAKFRHYGPMAQDFYAAFGHDGIGTIGCDTLLSSSDFDGINFIAIQALEKRTSKLQSENEQLKTEIAMLKSKMEKFESLLLKIEGLSAINKQEHQKEFANSK